MKTLINSVQLIGRLAADAEIKMTNHGTKVCNIRLATNEYSKNSNGDWVETTYWHSLVFWGKLAEKLGKIGKKGTRLTVQGTLTYREYTDTNGLKRDITEIKVNQFMALNVSPASYQEAKASEEVQDLPF